MPAVDAETSIIPVICNFTAKPENEPSVLKKNIINQVTNKVKWREIMDFLKKNNVKNVIECGSGKVLCGLFKRYSNSINTFNIENISDLKIIENIIK